MRFTEKTVATKMFGQIARIAIPVLRFWLYIKEAPRTVKTNVELQEKVHLAQDHRDRIRLCPSKRQTHWKIARPAPSCLAFLVFERLATRGGRGSESANR